MGSSIIELRVFLKDLLLTFFGYGCNGVVDKYSRLTILQFSGVIAGFCADKLPCEHATHKGHPSVL